MLAATTHSRSQSRSQQIVAAARTLLDAEGRDAVTMRRIAAELGIRAPSLYKHFAGKAELEAALISHAFAEQAEVFEAAIRDGADPLADIAAAYRAFARAQPHLYRLMTDGPLRRDLLAPGVEERAAAPLVAAAGGDRDRARAAWAFAHGMTLLELTGRFPPGADVDEAWRRGIEAFRASTDHQEETT